jgi:hypothetical protein
LFVCLVIACLHGSAHAGESPGSLTAARTLWNKAKPESYSYVAEERTTAVTLCRGPDSKFFSINPVRISVRKGSVARVESSLNGKLPASCFENLDLHTIDWLFDFIDREQGECDGGPLIEARYDARFGFPYYVNQRCTLDGSIYTVQKFRVLK